MLLPQLPGPGVLREPCLIGIEIELAGAPHDVGRTDLAQDLDMLLDRIGEQRRQRLGDTLHRIGPRCAHEPRQPRRGLRQIGQRNAQRRGGIEQHAQRRRASRPASPAARRCRSSKPRHCHRSIRVRARRGRSASRWRRDAGAARPRRRRRCPHRSRRRCRVRFRSFQSIPNNIRSGDVQRHCFGDFEFRPPLRKECRRRIRCIPLFSSAINTFDRNAALPKMRRCYIAEPPRPYRNQGRAKAADDDSNRVIRRHHHRRRRSGLMCALTAGQRGRKSCCSTMPTRSAPRF